MKQNIVPLKQETTLTIPPEWTNGVARLKTMACPSAVTANRWQQIVADAENFMATWVYVAVLLGWKTAWLFGCLKNAPGSTIQSDI